MAASPSWMEAIPSVIGMSAIWMAMAASGLRDGSIPQPSLCLRL